MKAPKKRTAASSGQFPYALALGVAAFALYLPALGNGLTNWDDTAYVVLNPIAAQGLGGIGQAIIQPFDGAWYPLTQVVYCILHALAGASAFAHHLAQVLVFAAAVALAPAALATFGVPRTAGIVAALLWAAHPFRVESVAWAANLKDALMALGVVAAFALQPRHRSASALAFGAAMLAKSMAFPLAALFVLLERSRGGDWGSALRRSFAWWGPAVVFMAIAASLHGDGGGARAHPGGSWLAAVPTALWLPWWYLGRVLLPLEPRAVYDFEAVGLLDVRLAAALVLWALAGAVVWWRRAERNAWTFGAAAWLLPLLPVLGLVPLAQFVAERYTLLPSLALAAGLAVALHRLLAARAAWVVAAPAIVILATASLARQPDWRDAISLWEANRNVAPGAFSVRYNLGLAYAAERRFDEAIAELREARRLDPSAVRALDALVMAQGLRLGVPERALATWHGAAKRDAFSDAALAAIAAAAAEQGQVAFAHAVLDEGSASAAVLTGRARVAVLAGDWPAALDAARGARRLDAGMETALVYEAIALVELGRLDEAIEVALTAVADAGARAQLAQVRAMALQDRAAAARVE